MSMNGQGTKQRRKIAENFKSLSTSVTDRQQTTDGRATAYSERERSLKTTDFTQSLSEGSRGK